MFDLSRSVLLFALYVANLVNNGRANPVLGYVVYKDSATNEIAINGNPNIKLQAIGDRLYYFGTVLQGNWHQALQFCNYHEMQLLSIETAKENEALFQKLQPYLMGGSGGEYRFWSSGTSLQDPLRYTWIATGNPIVYANWFPGQPTNIKGNERCVEIVRPANGKALLWSNADCSLPRFVICETAISKCASQWITNHGNCSLGLIERPLIN